MSTKRVYLNIGDIIELVRDDAYGDKGKWQIDGAPIGEGASSVCYPASCGNKHGRLKEFNPIGKTINKDSIEDFLSAYKTLDAVKSKNQRYAVLNNYIPHYEMLLKKDENGETKGAYIWTPDDKSGKNFADYLANVRANPTDNPEKKLQEIINIIITLSDCICLLHMAGILHMDIKPSNFLVTYNSRFELNTGNISMFDLNTLYSVESEVPALAGTEGFSAPELEYGRADNRADIYSIGAILFNAIVISEKEGDEYYHNDYYEEIDSRVSESKLISASVANSKSEIVNRLAIVLKRCLSVNPSYRYDYCELLIKDLEDISRLLGTDSIKNRTEEQNDINPPDESDKKNRTVFPVLIGLAAVFVLAIVLWLVNGFGNANKSTESMVTTLVNNTLENTSDVSETEESASETDISKSESDMPVKANTPKEAGEALNEALKLAHRQKNPEAKEVTADIDLLGSDTFGFEGQLIIPEDVTLIIPEGIYYIDLGDYNENKIDVAGRLVCDPYETFSKTTNDGRTMLWLRKGSSGNFAGVEMEVGSSDYWVSAFLDNIYDPIDHNFVFVLNSDMKVKASHDDFSKAGFDYLFGYGVEEMSIYFNGSDEPYDYYKRNAADNLQLEIEALYFEGGEIIVDYPVVVEKDRELWIHTNVTVRVIEGGSITVEDGGKLYLFGRLIEAGGTLDVEGRTDRLAGGSIVYEE